MEKPNIKVYPNICTLCQCCQLQCSFVYIKAFNPERARIIPNPPEEIKFTDDCVANCSLCTKYCPVGAIVVQ